MRCGFGVHTKETVATVALFFVNAERYPLKNVPVRNETHQCRIDMQIDVIWYQDRQGPAMAGNDGRQSILHSRFTQL